MMVLAITKLKHLNQKHGGGNQYENYVVGLFKLYAPHRVLGVGRNSCYAGSVQRVS